ncbi:MAG: TrkA family potassium uptake protein [Eubacterium sp.]|nr:TrkA family potassium uptake protein [Eubacterium sp.]
MKSILLIGLGRLGTNLAKELSDLGHEVMAVDCNEERVNKVMPYVTNGQIGNSIDPEFLESLGINNFDICVVTMHSNFQNSLETTSQLKDMGAKVVISRAESDIHEKFLLKNGADKVIYPESQVAKWTAIRYTSDEIVNYIELDNEYSIFEVAIPKEWAGKRVDEVHIRKKYNINILAIKTGDAMNMDIKPDVVFEENDVVVVLGTLKLVKKCFKF